MKKYLDLMEKNLHFTEIGKRVSSPEMNPVDRVPPFDSARIDWVKCSSRNVLAAVFVIVELRDR